MLILRPELCQDPRAKVQQKSGRSRWSAAGMQLKGREEGMQARRRNRSRQQEGEGAGAKTRGEGTSATRREVGSNRTDQLAVGCSVPGRNNWRDIQPVAANVFAGRTPRRRRLQRWRQRLGPLPSREALQLRHERWQRVWVGDPPCGRHRSCCRPFVYDASERWDPRPWHRLVVRSAGRRL